MRSFSFILLVFLFSPSIGKARTTELEQNLNSYIELVRKAREFNLKSITKINGKKTKFKADFDPKGNIEKIVDYHYKRNGFEEINFVCKEGLIIEYETKVSFLKKSFRQYYFEYDKQNRPITLISKFFWKGELNEDPDTTRIYYNDSGNFDYKTYRNGKDTVVYFYSNDSLIGTSSAYLYRKEKIKDQRVYNEFGCFIGHYNGSSNYRSFSVRDQNCNLLGWQTDVKIYDQWITNWKYEAVFRNDTLIEETYYYTDKFNKKDLSKIKPKFKDKWTYHYNQYGLLIATRYWNEKGKLTGVVRRKYEYYE